ncbi:MAG: efflux RND transporter permease subunit [Bdellovibrionales bacterium]|nr:efflux RND transporter permease subunit [Bdellovibrionales bacterium]
MTLSEVSIRKPVFAWMLMAGLIVFGAISFTRMGVSQLPDVDFPIVSVSAFLDGAAPEVMETDVVDIIEDSLMSIEGVKSIVSSSRNSSASITVEFDLGRNIDIAMQDVQSKIAQVQRRLPREMDPVSVSKTNPEDQPILWLTLESKQHKPAELMSYVRDYVKQQFSTIAGVGEISLGGYVDPNLRIWVRDKDLDKYSLAVNDVISAIQNEHSEPPAGRLESGVKEFNVRTLGEAQTVKEFESLTLSSRGGQPNFARMRLRDVADVEEGLADVRRVSRGLGNPAVGLGIRKQRGSNAVSVADAVLKKMEAVQKTLPPGMKMAVNFDSTRFIKDSVNELNFNLVLSALFTAFVCWLFLGSWSSTFNVLLAIPTSVVGTFIFLYFAKFTLNTFTLLALSLSIGIVVDDAIMVLENILRHREMKKTRTQAAIDGATEITFAALAATVSIVAVFLPVAFMSGIIGKFFFQFGVTMAVAVLLSLVEALTLTPMRCAQFVDTHERTSRFGRFIEAILDGVSRLYHRSLERALNWKWAVILISLVVFGLSMISLKHLNKEFVPPEDQSRFIIRAQTPVGSSLSFTDERFRKIEEFLSKQPEVLRYYTSVGGGAGGEVNSGFVFVTLKQPNERKLTQMEVMNVARKAFKDIPDLKAGVIDLSQSGFSASRGYPVEFTIQGPSWEELGKQSELIRAEMEKSKLVTDIDSDFQTGMPEIHIIPDREAAALHGVSIGAIGETVNALIGGVLVGRYPKDGHRNDIRLRLKEDGRPRLDRIRSLYVRNNRGELIPLSRVVKVEEKPTLQVISRKNRERAITIFANVAPGASQQKALEAIDDIGKRVLPAGYRIVLSGSSQTFQESFQSLAFALVLGLFVAYMVLASQFNSFIDPLTVFAALPFSLSGAFVSLLIGHQSLNIYSMIGLILLMGIVKKNSILLVDFTNQVRDRSPDLPVKDALVEACPIRLRPILMTSIATVAGAIPPAMAIGPGAESRIPMAVAIIGGVLISTLLTLYVVPSVYLIVARKHRRHVEA